MAKADSKTPGSTNLPEGIVQDARRGDPEAQVRVAMAYEQLFALRGSFYRAAADFFADTLGEQIVEQEETCEMSVAEKWRVDACELHRARTEAIIHGDYSKSELKEVVNWITELVLIRNKPVFYHLPHIHRRFEAQQVDDRPFDFEGRLQRLEHDAPPRLIKSARQQSIDANLICGIASMQLGVVGESWQRKATFWWRRAADRGVPEAEYRSALAYARGIGIKRNRSQASVWLKRAAQQGHMLARAKLAERTERSRSNRRRKVREEPSTRASIQGAAEKEVSLHDLRIVIAWEINRSNIGEWIPSGPDGREIPPRPMFDWPNDIGHDRLVEHGIQLDSSESLKNSIVDLARKLLSDDDRMQLAGALLPSSLVPTEQQTLQDINSLKLPSIARVTEQLSSTKVNALAEAAIGNLSDASLPKIVDLLVDRCQAQGHNITKKQALALLDNASQQVKDSVAKVLAPELSAPSVVAIDNAIKVEQILNLRDLERLQHQFFRQLVFGAMEPSLSAFRAWTDDLRNRPFATLDERRTVVRAANHWAKSFKGRWAFQGKLSLLQATTGGSKAGTFVVREAPGGTILYTGLDFPKLSLNQQ